MVDEILSKAFIINVFGGVLGSLLLIVIAKLYKHAYKIPIVFKLCRISSRKKQLNKVKNNRNDDRYYLYELQKAQNWFITFLFVITVNFVFLISNGILNFSAWLFFILMAPSFIVEIFWLSKVSYVEDLRVYQKDNLEWKKRKQRKNRRRARKLKNKVLS